MLPHDPTQQTQPTERPDSPVEASSQTSVGFSPADPVRIKSTRLWSRTLGAGMVAGLIAGGIGEAAYGLFQWNDARDVLKAYSSELKKLGPYEQNEFITKRMVEARVRAESCNTAIAFGVLGALLGLALGRAGGIVIGSSRSGARGGRIGFAVAGALGVVMAFPVVPLYYKFASPTSGLAVPLATHAALLLPLAAACGLALGIGLGGRQTVVRGILGALMGALIAVLVFDMVNTIAFPLEQEPAPVPGERMARLLIHLCSALFVAGFATLGVAGEPKDLRPGSR
jgi:hypothetical protein